MSDEVSMPIFVCCICLGNKDYKPKDGRLTVINGRMLCVDHTTYAGSAWTPNVLVW